MPETNYMPKFMNNYSKLVTIFSYAYGLRTIASFANKWAASINYRILVKSNKKYLYYSLVQISDGKISLSIALRTILKKSASKLIQI